MKLSALCVIACLAASACVKYSDQMTLENARGETVVCKPPPYAPELSDFGRTALVEWCSVACSEHGYRWIGQRWEEPVMILDLDLGKRERLAAEKYLPLRCLPFDPPPMGIVRTRDGGIPDCTGVLFRDGKCPDWK